MKQADWMRVVGKIDDVYIEEALFKDQDAPSVNKREIIPMNNTRKKKLPMRFGILVAVLAMILALSVTAYATGFVDSVIAKMAAAWAVYDPAQGARYEAAVEKSNKEPETQNLTQLVGTAMTMEESYYDGESLMIVYSLDSVQMLSFDFDPDSEGIGNLEKCQGRSMESLLMEYDISYEDYQTIREKLEADGKTGFRIRRIGLGDHVLLTDGMDLGPMMGVESDGKFFMECQDGLPEEAKNREQLEIEFTIKCRDYCFYVEGDDIYLYCPQLEEETVIFTVKNCSNP